MTKSEEILIRELFLKRITEQEFINIFGKDIITNKDEMKNLIKEVCREKKSDDLEYLLNLLSRFYKFSRDDVEFFCDLLNFNWHFMHEDVVSILQQLRSPKSIETLYQTSKKEYEYLEYDDTNSLARKCMFALGNIGTPEAICKLKLLSQSPNTNLHKYAKEQLEREDILKI